jgi:hypothetical protein
VVQKAGGLPPAFCMPPDGILGVPRCHAGIVVIFVTWAHSRFYNAHMTGREVDLMTHAWIAPEIEEQSQIVAKLCGGGGGNGSGGSFTPTNPTGAQ